MKGYEKELDKCLREHKDKDIPFDVELLKLKLEELTKKINEQDAEKSQLNDRVTSLERENFELKTNSKFQIEFLSNENERLLKINIYYIDENFNLNQVNEEVKDLRRQNDLLKFKLEHFESKKHDISSKLTSTEFNIFSSFSTPPQSTKKNLNLEIKAKMIDTKKTDEKIPEQILTSEKIWLQKNNGYLGLIGSEFPSVLVYTISTLFTIITVSFILVTTTNISGYNKENLKHNASILNCTCDCWDAFYRGKHPRQSRNSEFKYLYFNYKTQTIYLLVLSLFYLQLLTNLFQKVIGHLINFVKTGQKSLRLGVLLILGVNVYSNFWYGWNMWNFINDRDERFSKDLSCIALLELVITFLYYLSLERLSLTNGNYKPITMSTIAPLCCLNMLNFFMRLPRRLEEKFFVTFEPTLFQIEEGIFFMKEVLAILFTYFAWRTTNRPSYPHLAKKDLKGKGVLINFGLWFVLTGVYAALRRWYAFGK
ncbi:unnamed protein product [Brachionus calyciflorus]|uniref:Uncharacterized protein n=1 Tax=Brachionus calyciflorus TaxID=104777 RepID=A0A813ZC33_9BILA|nr:unnamed protein product [Brachionus calyciflorus]